MSENRTSDREYQPRRGRRSLVLAATLAFIFYLLVAFLFTWPLVRHLGSSTMFLDTWGDNIGVLTSFWYSDYWRAHGKTGTSVNTLVGYPFGRDQRGLPSYPMSLGVVRQLTRVFGFVTAYNIFLLIGFPLAGLAMFLLIVSITRSRSAALISGFAFTFSSWHLVRAAEHISLAAIYCIPLFMLALVHFWRKRDVLSSVILAVATAFAFLTDYHLGYFCAVIAVIWLLTSVVMVRRGNKAFKPVNRRLVLLACLAILLAAVAVFPVARAILYKNPSVYEEFNPRGGLVNVALNSSRPWNYFVPSYYNPFLGRLFRSYSLAHWSPLSFTESAAYIGILPFALALYAVWGLRRRKKQAGEAELDERPADGAEADSDGIESACTEGDPSENEEADSAVPDGTLPSQDPISGVRPFVWFAIILAVVSFLLSLPPEWNILGVKVPWISRYQRWILPSFRGYSRWAVMVIFAVALLAGIGWSLLVRNRKLTGRKVVILAVAALVLIAVDFTIEPPSRARELPVAPAVLQMLAERPDKDPIVIYPITNPNDYRFYQYVYYQTRHEHPMLNGTTRATEDDLYRLSVLGYNSQYTPRILKALGIQYAVFLSEYFSSEIRLDPAMLPDGFTLIASKGEDYIFDITAPAAPVIPLYYSGFQAPSVFSDGKAYAQMVTSPARMILDVRKEGEYSISFSALSPGQAREFAFSVDGREIGCVGVPAEASQVVLPRVSLAEGKHELDIKMSDSTTLMDGEPSLEQKELTTYLVIGDINVQKRE